MATFVGTPATSTTTVPYYQTRTYLELFKSCAYVAGIEPDRILTDDAEAVRDFLNTYLREGWEYYPWPHLMQTFLDTYANRNNYAEYDLFSISEKDPRETKNYKPYTYSIDAEGINLVQDLDDDAELYFRHRYLYYRLSGGEFDDTLSTSYAFNAMVYETDTGDYYRSLADGNSSALTDTAWWDRRRIPDFLYEFAKGNTLANLREAQGQGEKASRLKKNAWISLNLEIEKWERQKNQQLRPNYRQRTGGASS